jgi:hypothetical protein
MPLVLDASNILHVTGVLPPELAGPDERGLVDLIRASRWRGERIWVVCDGGRRASSSEFHDGAVLHHAGPGSDADTVIAKLIETCSHRNSLIVVTSDRRVAAHARRRDCRTLRSEEFLAALARDCAGRTAPRASAKTTARTVTRTTANGGARAGAKGTEDAARIDAAQVAAWLAYFGLSEQRAASVEQDAAHAAEREAARLARELGIRARDAARRRTR